MSYIPLKLGVGRFMAGVKSRKPAHVYTGEDIKQIKAQVFERDDHTCSCCGFRAEKYQDVFHKDFDKTNYALDNLVTTCVFCHQVFHLEQAAHMRSGVMVWLPEVGQAALHHIMRAIYVARVTQGPMADAARSALDLLMSRRDEAKKRIGTDDPAVLARIFQDFMEDKEYEGRHQKIDGLRLLPLDRRIIREGELDFNQFPQILAYWRSKKGPFGATMPTSWPSLLEAAQASVSE